MPLGKALKPLIAQYVIFSRFTMHYQHFGLSWGLWYGSKGGGVSLNNIKLSVETLKPRGGWFQHNPAGWLLISHKNAILHFVHVWEDGVFISRKYCCVHLCTNARKRIRFLADSCFLIGGLSCSGWWRQIRCWGQVDSISQVWSWCTAKAIRYFIDPFRGTLLNSLLSSLAQAEKLRGYK